MRDTLQGQVGAFSPGDFSIPVWAVFQARDHIHALAGYLECISVASGKMALLKSHDSKPAGGHGGGTEHGQNSKTSNGHSSKDQLTSTSPNPAGKV